MANGTARRAPFLLMEKSLSEMKLVLNEGTFVAGAEACKVNLAEAVCKISVTSRSLASQDPKFILAFLLSQVLSVLGPSSILKVLVSSGLAMFLSLKEFELSLLVSLSTLKYFLPIDRRELPNRTEPNRTGWY